MSSSAEGAGYSVCQKRVRPRSEEQKPPLGLSTETACSGQAGCFRNAFVGVVYHTHSEHARVSWQPCAPSLVCIHGSVGDPRMHMLLDDGRDGRAMGESGIRRGAMELEKLE